MARLVYSHAAAQQWPSWVVPLPPQCIPDRLKIVLLARLEAGTLTAFGLLEQHIILQFPKPLQACAVRRLLTSAFNQTLDFSPQSLDPFHAEQFVEQYGWETPEEACKKAEEAASSGDFKRLRLMLPGLTGYDDDDLKDNPLLSQALQRHFGLQQQALEDCPHELRGAPGECSCGKEARFRCNLCKGIWCNPCGQPLRRQQFDRENLAEMLEDLKQEPRQPKRQRVEVWHPAPPTLQVRTGLNLDQDRKLEWVLYRDLQQHPELPLERHQNFLPRFVGIFLDIFKKYMASGDSSLTKTVLTGFEHYMRQEQPDYKAPAVRDLPLELRCAVESILKGQEVNRCERCAKESCKCRCKCCGRLGPHQNAECDRQKRIEKEWENPRCRKCPYKGELEKVQFPKPMVWTQLLPGFKLIPADPNDTRAVMEWQRWWIIKSHRQECEEKGIPTQIWGCDDFDNPAPTSDIKATETKPMEYVWRMQCPQCHEFFKPPSADTQWPPPPAVVAQGSEAQG